MRSLEDEIVPDEPSCFSPLALDCLLADEGTSAQQQHLQSCGHCREQLDALRVQQAEFLTTDRVFQATSQLRRGLLAPPPETSPRGRWSWLWAGFGTIAAAAAVLILMPRLQGQEVAGNQTRLKGNAGFRALYRDGGNWTPIGEQSRVRPGSELAFQSKCAEKCFVTIVVASGNGETVILEADVPAPWEMSGPWSTLPVSANLDGSDQPDRFVAFLCNAPVSPTEISTAAVQAYGKQVLKEAELSISGCSIHSVLVERADD